MSPAQVTAALDAAAAAGQFFAVDTDRPSGSSAPGPAPPWRRFTELTTGPAVLAGRIDAVRRAVAERSGISVDAVDPRSAASLTHLGLAARLVCPPLATALLGGVLLELDPARLWWRDVLGPVPLALPDPTGRAIESDDVTAIVAALAGDLSRGPVGALTAAVAAGGISRKVLWGNVASAVANARAGLLAAAPERGASIWATLEGLLAVEPLAGSGVFRRPGSAEGFRRNSCCLYYRVPGGGYCGDCVLA
jgi:hypothetical protein